MNQQENEANMLRRLAPLFLFGVFLSCGCGGQEGSGDPRCESLKHALTGCGLSQAVPAEATCTEPLLQAHASLASSECQGLSSLLDDSKADWFYCDPPKESCWLFFCCAPEDAPPIDEDGTEVDDPDPDLDPGQSGDPPQDPPPTEPSQPTEPDNDLVYLTLYIRNHFGVGLANAKVIIPGAYGFIAFVGDTDAAGQLLVLLPRGTYRVQVWHSSYVYEFKDVQAPGSRLLTFPYY